MHLRIKFFYHISFYIWTILWKVLKLKIKYEEFSHFKEIASCHLNSGKSPLPFQRAANCKKRDEKADFWRRTSFYYDKGVTNCSWEYSTQYYKYKYNRVLTNENVTCLSYETLVEAIHEFLIWKFTYILGYNA